MDKMGELGTHLGQINMQAASWYVQKPLECESTEVIIMTLFMNTIPAESTRTLLRNDSLTSGGYSFNISSHIPLLATLSFHSVYKAGSVSRLSHTSRAALDWLVVSSPLHSSSALQSI